jgi:hypothetical protein
VQGLDLPEKASFLRGLVQGGKRVYRREKMERIKREYGQSFQKSDVNQAHWTFQGRDIWTEISRLLKDPEYVLSIPVIDGAKSALQEISQRDLCVVTARRPEVFE